MRRGDRCAGARACSPPDVPAHEVADLYPSRGGPGGLEHESPGQVSRHVVVAERGQQHRTGSFGARTEFVKHLADERRFTGGIQVYRARFHRRGHDGPADLHERSRSRHEYVTGPDEVPQRPGSFRRRDRRLQLGPVACLREPGGERAQPALVTARQDRTGQPRRTPVCDGLDGDTFWLVAQRGHRADWVRNIAANPRIRVKFAAAPASAGEPGRRTSSTMTTRASGSGSWPRPTSRAAGAYARQRRWTPAR